MKAAETALNLKEIPYRPQKKFLKRKEKNIAPAKANAPTFTNFFRMPKSNNSDLSNGKQRT